LQIWASFIERIVFIESDSEMKDIEYVKIFKKALLMTWHNKSMWFFGALIFLGSLITRINPNIKLLTKNANFLQQKVDSIQISNAAASFILITLIVIIIFVYCLKLVGTASIIKISNNLAVYGQMKIRTIFAEAINYIWRLFLVDLVIGVSFASIVISLFIPIAYLYVINSQLIAGMFFAFEMLLLLPLFILVFYIRRYAQIYTVLGEMKLGLSLESAYDLFRKNLKESLIMGIMIICSYFSIIFFSFIVALAVAVIIVPIGLILYIVLAGSAVSVSLVIGVILLIAVISALI